MQRLNPTTTGSGTGAEHGGGDRTRITVMEGSRYVSDNPEVVMSTVLGSCVAACLFDPLAKIGGMNHFLLAEPIDGAERRVSEEDRYGAYAMEVLVNEMLKRGALRSRLKAHLYGGAGLRPGMSAIGRRNCDFAVSFLQKDGIELSHSNLGGNAPRRVEFRAAMGQARCRLLPLDAYADQVPVRRAAPEPSGDVELF